MNTESRDMIWAPARVLGRDRPGNWIVLCDHASNTVPPAVNEGALGLAPEDMARHIAYDVGAAGVSLCLGELLDAPVVMSNFSRLVIDPNRGEDDPTLLMKLYDGTIIPANRHADAAEVQRRLDLCYRPYHAAVAQIVADRPDAAIISIHSFTPQLRGKPPRPWEIAVLYSHRDTRLSLALADLLDGDETLTVGRNVPYGGELAGDTIDSHALPINRQNTLIELRNDLIADETGQLEWAARLAHLLPDALANAT